MIETEVQIRTESNNADHKTDVEAAKEEPEETGVRYQPEWTKDAVIYEVNVRQYTEEGTFQAFSDYLQE